MRLLKKLISLTVSAFAVLLVSGFISLQPIAQSPALAQSTPSCEDATHTAAGTSTKPVIENVGTADSGMLNFDAYDSKYQACTLQSKKTRTLGVLVGDTPKTPVPEIRGYFLEGYAQNTNLGQVSFSCESGKNRNIACGTVDYGVVVPSSSSLQTDTLKGFAWAPNIGWISMGCQGGKNLADGDCGGVDYGVKVVIDATNPPSCGGRTLGEGDLYGYAWTNTVGWINFCGAHINVPAPIEGFLDPAGTLVEPNPNYPTGGTGAEGGDDGRDNPPVNPPPLVPPTPDYENESWGNIYKGPTVYANGDDSYKITVKLKQRGQFLAAIPDGHNITVIADFTGTTLRADQINGNDCNQITCANGAIITPTPTMNGNDAGKTALVWNDAAAGFVGEIKAIAPTNAKDKIVLKSLTLTIDGDRMDIDLNKNAPDNGWNLPFLPAVEVSQIISVDPKSGEETAGATISGTSFTIPRKIFLTARKHDGSALPKTTANVTNNVAITVGTQLYACNLSTNKSLFSLGQESDTAIPSTKNDLNTLQSTLKNAMQSEKTPCSQGSGSINTDLADYDNVTLSQYFVGQDQNAKTGTISRIIRITAAENSNVDLSGAKGNLGLSTTVSYTSSTGIPVYYLSKVSPNGSITDQAARVQGNVRIDVLKNITEDAVTKTVGAYAASKRDEYYKALKAIEGAATVTPIVSETIASITNLTAPTLKYYKNSSSGSPYKPCKIFIGNNSDPDGTDVNFNQNLTIASEGCDIYINSNIYAGASGHTGKLGIIALADASKKAAAVKRKGGNIYICNRVTDIEANIVAEGSLFGYGASETNCGDPNATGADKVIEDSSGYPVVTTYSRENLKRQLAIKGSIISNNTYGGSLQTPALLGDGTTTTSIETARLFDINFLRYAFTRAGDHNGDQAEICWADGVLPSKTISPDFYSQAQRPTSISCDGTNVPDPTVQNAKGIVNIIYRAPEAGMKVFNAVK